MNTIICLDCGKPIPVDPRLAGQPVVCPHCQQGIMPAAAPVPAPASEPLGFLEEPSQPTALARSSAPLGLPTHPTGMSYSKTRTSRKQGIPTGVKIGGGVLVGVLLVVGLIVGLGNHKDGGRGGSSTGSSGTEPAKKISSVMLLQAYTTNEIAADQSYKDRWLEVSGSIASVAKDVLDNPYVTLNSGDTLRSVQCYFGEDDEHQLAALSPGMYCTVRGRCDGLMMNVQLKDCSLVGPGGRGQTVVVKPTVILASQADRKKEADVAFGNISLDLEKAVRLSPSVEAVGATLELRGDRSAEIAECHRKHDWLGVIGILSNKHFTEYPDRPVIDFWADKLLHYRYLILLKTTFKSNFYHQGAVREKRRIADNFKDADVFLISIDPADFPPTPAGVPQPIITRSDYIVANASSKWDGHPDGIGYLHAWSPADMKSIVVIAPPRTVQVKLREFAEQMSQRRQELGAKRRIGEISQAAESRELETTLSRLRAEASQWAMNLGAPSELNPGSSPFPPPSTPTQQPPPSQIVNAEVPPSKSPSPAHQPAHDADKPPAKAPPPDAAAQQKAMKLVNDVYGDKYKNAKTPADIRNLLEEMMRKADETDDLTTRFVILRVARDIATKSRQIDIATDIIVKRDNIWVIDVVQEGRPVVEAGASAARLPAEFELVARLAMDLQKRSVAADDFDQANQFGEIALTAVRSAKNNDLQKEVVAKNKEVKERGQEFGQVQTAMATLKDTPNDADANLVLGRYECLTKGEWDKGLPRLAKASDDDWKKLANKELKGATSTEDQVDLGDDWWDFGGRKEGLLKKQLQKRAAFWYEKALPGATGLVKDKVVNRLATQKGSAPVSATATVSSPTPDPTQSPTKNGPLAGFKVVWNGPDNCSIDARTQGSGTTIVAEMRAHNLGHWGQNGLPSADDALNQGTRQLVDQLRNGSYKGKNLRETSRNDQSSDNILSRTITFKVEP